MPRIPLITSTTALAAALALVAAPAFANGSGQYADIEPWEWYVNAGGGEWGVGETWYDDGTTSGDDAWDGTQFVLLGPDYVSTTSASAPLEPAIPSPGIAPFACVTSTLAASGADQVISCTETVTTTWGLSITSDVRVLAPGDLARVTFLVTNTTASPVALGYGYSWSYGESTGHVRSTEPTLVQDTSEADGFLDYPDVWSYNVGDDTLNAGVAWGLAGQPFLGTDSFHDGYDAAAVELLPSAGRTIAAGETVAIAFFHKVQAPEPFVDGAAPFGDEATEPTSDGASEPAEMPVPQPASSHVAETPASFMAEFASFDGRLTRGLPTDATVGNWQPAAAPELAETGGGIDENLLMGGIAAALLGTGASLLIARRASLARARRRA